MAPITSRRFSSKELSDANACRREFTKQVFPMFIIPAGLRDAFCASPSESSSSFEAKVLASTEWGQIYRLEKRCQ